MTAGQPPTPTILYMHCTGGTECLSRTHGSHSVCAIRTLLGVDWEILSVRKEPILSFFSSHSKCEEHLGRISQNGVSGSHFQSRPADTVVRWHGRCAKKCQDPFAYVLTFDDQMRVC